MTNASEDNGTATNRQVFDTLMAERDFKSIQQSSTISLVLSNHPATLSFGRCSSMLPAMAEPVDPDAALMLRVKRGDTAAFAGLVEKYKRPLINLAHRMVRDPDEAEDLAQKIFVQAYRSAGRYKVTAKFSTWLFTIARNLCLNELRRRSRHPAESLEGTTNSEDGSYSRQFPEEREFSPPDALLQSELKKLIDQAVSELPEKQRTALQLCREAELSYDDIAEVLGCSLSATKSLIHRARETLKQKLKPYLRTGESWETNGTSPGKRS
jgi:RNA polymerase sigma-70 factor (ECF subfamily)